MTCSRTARSLMSSNMSPAPPARTLMLSHYWGGLPPSQGSAEASNENEFRGDYDRLLATVRFELVEPQSSLAIAFVGSGPHEHLGLVAILVHTGTTSKALCQRDLG